MKRLLCALAASVIALSAAVPAMAEQPSISVKNNVSTSRPVTYTYDGEAEGETAKSIKALMTKLKDLTPKNTVLQTLTVTSENDDGSYVDVKLRLSIPEKAASPARPQAVKTPSPEEYSSLDYYNIKITSTNGDVVYDYASAPETEEGATFKDIPLKTMNMEGSSDSETYNVTLTVNKDLNESSVASKAKNLDWSIVSEAYSPSERAVATASPSPAPETDESEKSPAPATESPTAATPAATAEASATPTATTTVRADKNGVYKLTDGEYITGTDVDAGRYTMTGTGKVHVYATDGALKTTIALKDKNDKTSNGVSEYVINLAKDERISVEDEIELTPFTARPTASPSPTSTPASKSSGTSSSGTSSSSKATQTPSPSSSKSNPKTGDSAPIAGISAVGITSLALSILLFIKMKRH